MATGAYEALVNQRIEALREVRFVGRQHFGEFMMRRYAPAMRTVHAAQARLEAMSSRSIRASNLLRTRVDVERSAQNQVLLESMDKRSDLQLRLQRTVEGLSVVAISYYAVSLVAYLLYPLAEASGLTKGMLTAVVTLPVVFDGLGNGAPHPGECGEVSVLACSKDDGTTRLGPRAAAKTPRPPSLVGCCARYRPLIRGSSASRSPSPR